MADSFGDKQRAANIRLLTAMAGGGMSRPQPNTPNYSAIPLQAPNQAPPQTPSPFDVPFTGLRNEGPNYSAQNLPPFTAPGSYGEYMMPPMDTYAAGPKQYGAPAPAPAAMPQMPPVQVEAPAMPMPDPRTAGDADMGGYGGSPRVFSQNEMYGHLNPTPSLEEIFRREYAANPSAFGKIG